MKKLFLRTTYANYYTAKEEEFTLRFVVPAGFSSVFAAARAITRTGMDPKPFRFLRFCDQIFPVGLQTPSRQLVLAKDTFWCRSGESVLTKAHYTQAIPYRIDRRMRSGSGNDRLAQDLMEAAGTMIAEEDPMTHKWIPYRDMKVHAINCCVLLATAFFERYIPVYELNVADRYFSLERDMPSRKKLWKQGVREINPFSGKIRKTETGRPYFFEDWQRDRVSYPTDKSGGL